MQVAENLSVKDCAFILGISPQLVRRLIADGRIQAVKFSKSWVIPTNTLKLYIPKKVGRPRKS